MFLQIQNERASDSEHSVDDTQRVSMHKVMSNSLQFSPSSQEISPNGHDAEQMELENALKKLNRLQTLGIDKSLLDSLRSEVMKISVFWSNMMSV